MDKPLKVLLIEDSKDDAELLLLELRRGGYTPVHKRVETPDGFAEAVQDRSWDIVLSDYSMPLFSPLAAIKELHRLDYDVPFIIVSGAIGEETAVKCMRAGVHDYIMKDNLARLIPAIERELQDRAVRRERKHAEAALEESERLFRAIFDQTFQFISLLRPNGDVMAINRTALDFINLKESDIVDKPFWETPWWSHSASDQNKLQKAVTQAAANKLVRFETGYPAPDGTIRFADFSLKPVTDNERNVLFLLAEARDITERRQSEEELRYTKNYLNNVFNSLPSILISIDPQGIITQVNVAAEKHLGLASSKALGERLWDTASWLATYRKDCEEVIAHQKPRLLLRESIATEQKRYYDILISPLVINGTEGVVIRMDDITDGIKKDELLLQAQKMETVGTLAGGIAHDFNNVLSGIVGVLSLLQFKINNGENISNDELAHFINIMTLSGSRATDMSRQLLSLSRKQELSFTRCDLNDSIKHIIKLCRNTFDKSIEMHPVYFEDDAMVNADAAQIEQLLLNLCINANHAMTIMREGGQPQGGALTIALNDFESDTQFLKKHPGLHPGRYWRLSVTDTGVGMDRKILHKIYDPFFTTKEKDRGTGLGLAMVYNIVELHQGCIDVDSHVGRGTTMNVYLPQVSPTETKAATPSDKSIAHGSGLILVVDDEPTMCETAKALLEECGYSAVVADNGRTAVDIFRRRHSEISAVFLDLMMPKMTGKEAFLEMKKIDPEIRAVLASGLKLDDKVGELMKAGVKQIVQKPYTLKKLAQSIHAAIHS